MRYREASTVPGKNLLSPRREEDDEPRGIGERRLPEEDEGATVRVAKTSESSASPQEAQKRLSSGFSRAHDGHLAMDVPGWDVSHNRTASVARTLDVLKNAPCGPLPMVAAQYVAVNA